MAHVSFYIKSTFVSLKSNQNTGTKHFTELEILYMFKFLPHLLFSYHKKNHTFYIILCMKMNLRKNKWKSISWYFNFSYFNMVLKIRNNILSLISCFYYVPAILEEKWVLKIVPLLWWCISNGMVQVVCSIMAKAQIFRIKNNFWNFKVYKIIIVANMHIIKQSLKPTFWRYEIIKQLWLGL